mmetsp:Transcript_2329/g.5206  ORF Transcript_2329/g.5206 Transcript_2329/m.5206 type:complete len:173 (-) Transcript_2329:3206-3724(-)
MITFSVEFSASKAKHSISTYAMASLILALMTSIVAIGALGSIQNQIQGEAGNEYYEALQQIGWFRTGTPEGKKLFRYYWFIVSYEIAIVAAGIALAWSCHFNVMRTPLMGLFAVGTMLFIQASDAWVTGNDLEIMQSGVMKDRWRAGVAGFIMTATVNAVLVLVLGTDCPEC